MRIAPTSRSTDFGVGEDADDVRPALEQRDQSRSNMVGIFANPKSLLRLVGAILMEQDDEWTVIERRSFSASSMKQLAPPALPDTAQEIFAPLM